MSPRKVKSAVIIGFFLVFAGVFGCESCEKTKNPPKTGSQRTEKPDARLIVVTNIKGELEPCGCTSHPLGGLDHLAAAIEKEATIPHLVLVAGDIYGEESGEVANWRKAVVDEFLESSKAERFDQDKSVNIGEWPIFVLGGKAMKQQTNETNALIIAAEGSASINSELSDKADFIVHAGAPPPRSDELPPAPQKKGNAFVVRSDERARGFVVIDLYSATDKKNKGMQDISEWSIEAEKNSLSTQIDTLATRIDDWKKKGFEGAQVATQEKRLAELKNKRDKLKPSPRDGRAAFSARYIRVDDSLGTNKAMRAAMGVLNKRINEHNKTTLASKAPLELGPGDIGFVGSNACASCHQKAFDWWQNHPHGRAYATLEKVDKNYHLDCVGCHVTGYEKPGGSTVTHLGDQGQLQNVGCENCHGPGKAHISAPKEHPLTRVASEQVCVRCHNEEHSDKFDYETYKATLRVPGHGAK